MAKKQTNSFDISGKILEIGGPERRSATFSKRTVVMLVFAGKYSSEVPFEFVNQNMDQIKDVKEGDWVTINYQLRAQKNEKDGITRRYTRVEGISCYRE